MNELPSTAFGVMRLLPDTKTGVDLFSKQLISAVENGEVNPLELKSLFKFMEAVFKKVDEGTKENQLREADKHLEKAFLAYGFQIEKSENGTAYDYAGCNDPIYNQRLRIFEEAKAQLNDRAALLKALKEPITVVDDESGEIATVTPPRKTSTSGLKFTMK